nr:MAG TPA: hypothetical protein [Caudoviricetes sp.]
MKRLISPSPLKGYVAVNRFHYRLHNQTSIMPGGYLVK